MMYPIIYPLVSILFLSVGGVIYSFLPDWTTKEKREYPKFSSERFLVFLSAGTGWLIGQGIGKEIFPNSYFLQVTCGVFIAMPIYLYKDFWLSLIRRNKNG